MNKSNSPSSFRYLTVASAVATLIALGGFSDASAAVLTTYGFESTLAATDVASDITATSVSFINGLSDGGTNAGYKPNPRPGSSGTTAIQFNGVNIGPDDTIAGTAIAFTLTPDSSQQFGVVTWWMQAAKKGAGGASGAYTGSSQLFVSDDNFATTLGSSALFSSIAPSGDTTVGTYIQGSYDLSSFGALSGDVSFRLVLTDDSGSNTRMTRIDDITVNTIPEPITMGLLFGSMGIVLLFGRRRVTG